MPALTRRGNPLFIPEMRFTEDGARNVFYAIGQHDWLGTSPFAVNSLVDPSTTPLAHSYTRISCNTRSPRIKAPPPSRRRYSAIKPFSRIIACSSACEMNRMILRAGPSR